MGNGIPWRVASVMSRWPWEVEVEDSAVEVEIEMEAAQSRSARIRAAFRELDGVDVPAMLARRCHAERAKIFVGSIPQCRARDTG